MRRIERTGQFRRDYKRELKGRYRAVLQTELATVLNMLIDGKALTARYRDHALAGEWADHRDCHVKPDLVLIYRLADPETLQLVRLGSHAELGL